MIKVQYARCWPCQFGDHYDPPKAHTWMDDEDAEHAGVTLPVDPHAPGRLCGCVCAGGPGACVTVSTTPEQDEAIKRAVLGEAGSEATPNDLSGAAGSSTENGEPR